MCLAVATVPLLLRKTGVWCIRLDPTLSTLTTDMGAAGGYELQKQRRNETDGRTECTRRLLPNRSPRWLLSQRCHMGGKSRMYLLSRRATLTLTLATLGRNILSILPSACSSTIAVSLFLRRPGYQSVPFPRNHRRFNLTLAWQRRRSVSDFWMATECRVFAHSVRGRSWLEHKLVKDG